VWRSAATPHGALALGSGARACATVSERGTGSAEAALGVSVRPRSLTDTRSGASQ
jgi:hypothetical protein